MLSVRPLDRIVFSDMTHFGAGGGHIFVKVHLKRLCFKVSLFCEAQRQVFETELLAVGLQGQIL